MTETHGGTTDMNTIFDPTHNPHPFTDLTRALFLRTLRPLTRDGRVVWVRLGALLMSLLLIVILIARMMFPGTGGLPFVASAARVTTPAVAPSVLRAPAQPQVVLPHAAPAPTKRVLDAGVAERSAPSRVTSTGHPLADPRPTPSRHVDPLETVGLDPTTPKHHVDPLETVGLDPTTPKPVDSPGVSVGR